MYATDLLTSIRPPELPASKVVNRKRMEDDFRIHPRLQHDIIPDQEREDAKSTEKRTHQPSSEVVRPCARIANWPTRLLTSI